MQYDGLTGMDTPLASLCVAPFARVDFTNKDTIACFNWMDQDQRAVHDSTHSDHHVLLVQDAGLSPLATASHHGVISIRDLQPGGESPSSRVIAEPANWLSRILHRRWLVE